MIIMHTSSAVSSQTEAGSHGNFHRLPRRSLSLAATLAVGLLGAFPGHAEVRSVKVVATPDAGVFQAAEVQCTGSSVARIIQQKVDNGNWCSKDLPNRCADTKSTLAQAVCTPGFSRELKELQKLPTDKTAMTQPAAEPVKAEQKAEPKADTKIAAISERERLAIEAKRIRIEQERLDLRKRDLELQNETLNLR